MSVLPPIDELVMPRRADGAAASPVLDALAQFAAPWNLSMMANWLRQSGLSIPSRVEAEYAAAAYFVIWHALESGADWKEAALADLKARDAARKAVAE